MLQMGGANLLLRSGVQSRRRRSATSVRAGTSRPASPHRQLPPIDAVLLSHNHYDHLDRASMRAVARQSGGAAALPRAARHGAWFARNLPRRRGAVPHIESLDWHATRDTGDTRRHAPAFPSGATLVESHGFDRNRSLWGSFAVVHPTFRFWFSGDLGYSPATRASASNTGPFDAAAIAIGAYEPRWFMRQQHVNPDEAVQVMLDVRARRPSAFTGARSP
jgi:N-acyl-phosphatidylethanolamine-hydrolysing phospholipase D